MATREKKRSAVKVLCGYCPDSQCNTKLYFPSYDNTILCSACGQRHQRKNIKDVAEVTDQNVALFNILKNVLVHNTKPKKCSDTVKVQGVSNYQCKLLSPLLTSYGMDKQGHAKLLSELPGQKSPSFDCSILSDRAFLLEPDRIEVTGYGRDRSGSMDYLKNTLQAIYDFNNGVECLIPIHADGDGHCLVHAVSRALIGRELFWHALRQNLKSHFEASLDRYKAQFRDFIDVNEWRDIIMECDPRYVPPIDEGLGLRNIHIFGLANVLKRPVILLDSLGGLSNKGDYSGTFLPGLLEPSQCCGKDGKKNKPICVAWSNQGRNHYIALVGVKECTLPKLPKTMMPQAWGLSQHLMPQYIDFNPDGSCTIGGDRCLQENYTLKLVNAMEHVFLDKHQVSTSLVADVHQDILKSSGLVNLEPELIIEQVQKSVKMEMLYRCLVCEGVMEMNINFDSLIPTGAMYKLAIDTHKKLDPSKQYSFPMNGLVCRYDAEKDILIPVMEKSAPVQCQWCDGHDMRHVRGDGSVIYKDGDRTKTRTTSTRCKCGYKHYWGGKEYDNLPEILPIVLEWNGKVIRETVHWWQYETNPALNSNVYDIAAAIVQTHFPGEFGSERLTTKVVDQILRQTLEKDPPPPSSEAGTSTSGDTSDPQSNIPMKIIISGQQTKSIHKEELNKSTTEKIVRKKIEHKAPQAQRRKTEKQSGTSQDTKLSPKLKKTDNKEGSPPCTESKPPETAEMPLHKKIKVCTSDGRQLMLTLDASMTYATLTERLTEALEVPHSRQKIKHGFPPKELRPPEEGQEDKPVPLQNGDRLTVEIIPEHAEAVPIRVPDHAWPVKPENRNSWSKFDANSHDHSAQDLLKGLEHLQDGGTDSLDTSIASLTLMATLMGKDLWSYVQGMPHLFSVGGLLYQQVKRDLGLSDGKHCTLPSLPGKVFRYNGSEDRLELCLEPHGHYPIEPGIENKILNTSLLNQGLLKPRDNAEVGKCLSSGASGVQVNKPMSNPHMPFSGIGRSLSQSAEDTRMPADLSPSHTSGHGTRAKRLSDSAIHHPHPMSIEEEDEDSSSMNAEGGATSFSQLKQPPPRELFTRIGPGITVLNRGLSEGSDTSEVFSNLASEINSIVEESESENEDKRQKTGLDNKNTVSMDVDVQENQKLDSRNTSNNAVLTNSNDGNAEDGVSKNCDSMSSTS